MKVIRFKKTLLLSALFLGFSYGVFAQNIGSISGQLKNGKGHPVTYINVFLDDGKIGDVSDEEGKYRLQNVPEGKHQLTIQGIGYEKIVKTIQLESGQSLTLNFTLDESSQQLGEVLIRGKSNLTKLNEQAYNVKAVSAKPFYNSNMDVIGILGHLPNVNIRREGGLGSDYIFSLSGFSGKQVKFFLNGIPMDNDGDAFNLSTIPANTIDRIEVYNGVVPISLGSDALGGAVNIITRQKANFLDASYTFGSFNTHRASVNGAFTDANGFTLRGNLNFDYSDNNYDVKVPVADNALGTNTHTKTVPRFHNRYRGYRTQLEAGWVNKPFADQLLFGVTVSGNDKQIQNGITMETVYGGIIRKTNSAGATLKYSKKDLFAKNLDVHFNASYSYSEIQNVDTLQGVVFNWAGKQFYTPGDQTGEYGTLPFDESNYDNAVNTQLNLDYKVNHHHSFGFNHSFEYFDRSAFDRRNPNKIVNQFPKSSYKNSLGLAYKYDYNKDWSTTVFGKAFFLKNKGSKVYGVVLDEDSRDTYQTNSNNYGYGIASSYFITPNLQVKASFEHTYRLPDPIEVFGDGLFTLANVDLRPEKSDNFNLGTDYHFLVNNAHRFKVGGSFIYRNAEDLIFRVVTASSPESSYRNLLKTRTLGAEGNVSYDFGKHLQIGGNLTYQNITNQAEYVYDRNGHPLPNFNKGARVPNRPYFFANANASYLFENVIWKESELKLSYYYHFVQEYYLSWEHLGYKNTKNVIPQQNSQDVEVVYSLKNGMYNMAFEVRNFTNARLYDQYYLQKPGRAFYLKLRYSF